MFHRGPGLVPAPSWYHFSIMDTSIDGFVAYGSRNVVVLIDARTKPILNGVFSTENSKISSLSFCKYRNAKLLATSSEDGLMKVWNLENKPAVVYALDMKKRISAVEWKYESDHIGFLACGKIVIEWNLLKKEYKELKILGVRGDILVLTSCTCEPHLLAIGYQTGLIIVYDTCREKVLHKLYGHESDVDSVTWPRESSSMIMSCAYDGTTRVWSLGEEVTYKQLVAPTGNRKFNKSNAKFSPRAVWHPIDSDAVITTSFNGDMWLWNVSEAKPKKAVFSIGSPSHCKMVLNLLASNFDDNKFVSSGKDSRILFWDVNDRKCVFELGCMLGSAFCLAFCPVDNGLLAIAGGDSSIRVWNTSAPEEYSVRTSYLAMTRRIMFLTWHPESDNTLAFATEDGRIGLLNCSTHRPTFLAKKHNNPVYSLSWGPCSKIPVDDTKEDAKEKSALFLYSCGDGKIFVHETVGQEKESYDFEELADISANCESRKVPFRTEVSWKQDFTALAVGNDDGYIEIFDGRTFTLIGQIRSVQKLIQCLSWHPLFVSVYSSKCSMHNWLAASSGEREIHVFDLEKVLSHECELPIVMNEPTRLLKGHKNRVTALCWSPHIAGRIVSASFDKTVQVWDVMTSEPVANFRGHTGRVFAVQWCMLDPDVIFSGGEDCTVLKWRISEQQETLPINIRSNSRKKKKKNEGESVDVADDDDDYDEDLKDPKDEKPQIIEDNHVVEENDKVENNQESGEESTIPESAIRVVAHVATRPRKRGTRGGGKKKKISVAFSSLVNSGDVPNLLEECVKMAEVLSGNKEDNNKIGNIDMLELGYFGDETATLRMLENDCKKDENQDFCSPEIYSVWSGNIGEGLREAAEKENLTDGFIAMAPLGSYSLWMEMCEKYATQLTKEKDYHKAVLYLLACHKIYEAINLLKENGFFRDALVLAKARLPHTDPIITEIMNKWCRQLVIDNQYELACKCFLAMGQPLSAAHIIFRRRNINYAKVAATICLKYGHIEEAKQFALLGLKRALLEDKWDVAKDIINEQPTLKSLQLVIAIHESLVEHSRLVKDNCHGFDKEYGLQRIWPDITPTQSLTIWKAYTVNGQNYLHHLVDVFISQGLLDPKLKSFSSAYEDVMFLLKREQQPSKSEGWYLMAVTIAAYFCTLFDNSSEESTDKAYQLINDLFRIFVVQCNAELLDVSCLLFMPYNVKWLPEKNDLQIESVGMKSTTDPLQISLDWLTVRVCEVFKTTSLKETKTSLLIDGFLIVQPNLIDHMLSSITITDSLLCFFAINLLENVYKQVTQVDSLICIETVSDQLSGAISESSVSNRCPVEFTNISDIPLSESSTFVENGHCDSAGSGERALLSDNLDVVNNLDIVTSASGNSVDGTECLEDVTNRPCNMPLNEIPLHSGSMSDVTIPASQNATENITENAESVTENFENVLNENNSVITYEINSMLITGTDATVSTTHNPIEDITEHSDESAINGHDNAMTSGGTAVLVTSTSDIRVEDHSSCESQSELFFSLLDRFVQFFCNDAFILKHMLKEAKQKADNGLLHCRGLKKREATTEFTAKDISVKDSVVSALSEDINGTTDSNAFQNNVQNGHVSETTLKSHPFSNENEPVYTNATSHPPIESSSVPTESGLSINSDSTEHMAENHVSKHHEVAACDVLDTDIVESELEISVVALEKRIAEIQMLQKLMEQKTSVSSLPDAFPAIAEIKELCKCVHTKLKCPVMKTKLDCFMDDLEDWCVHFVKKYDF